MFNGIFEAIEEWMRDLLTGMIRVQPVNDVYRCQRKDRRDRGTGWTKPARVEQQHIWDDTRIVGIGHRPHSRNDYHICPVL